MKLAARKKHWPWSHLLRLLCLGSFFLQYLNSKPLKHYMFTVHCNFFAQPTADMNRKTTWTVGTLFCWVKPVYNVGQVSFKLYNGLERTITKDNPHLHHDFLNWLDSHFAAVMVKVALSLRDREWFLPSLTAQWESPGISTPWYTISLLSRNRYLLPTVIYVFRSSFLLAGRGYLRSSCATRQEWYLCFF